MSKGSGEVFESKILKGKEFSEQRMTFCPLVEAWKELGCSDAEIDLFCDVGHGRGPGPCGLSWYSI